MVRLISIAIALAGCGIAPAAFAQTSVKNTWYVSADIGSSSLGVSKYLVGTPVEPRDAESIAYRLRVGFQFVRFFALEAGYVDLGSFETSVRVDCGAAPTNACTGDYRSEIDMRAFVINGVAALPIGDQFALRANLGWAHRTKKTHQIPALGSDYDLSSEKVLPFLGLSASYAIRPKLEITADWTKYQGEEEGYGVGPSGGLQDEADTEALSLGVRFRF